MNSKTFIEKSIKIHSSHFDYSFVDYVNNHYIHSFFIRNEIIQPLLKEHIEIIND